MPDVGVDRPDPRIERIVVDVRREPQQWPRIRGDLRLPNDLQGPADSVCERCNVRCLGE
jgi:hypothetical protein